MTERQRQLVNEAVALALRVALEGLPADADIVIGARALRDQLRQYITDYALARGVVLQPQDLEDELRALVLTAVWKGAEPSDDDLTPPPIEIPCGGCYGCITRGKDIANCIHRERSKQA